MLTRFGFRFLAAAVLASFGAVTSGANLLYLVGGMLWAFLAAGVFFARRNLKGVEIQAVFPEQVFTGTPFDLSFTLRRTKPGASRFLRLRTPRTEAFIRTLREKSPEPAVLASTLTRRGLNEIGDVWIESSFPFGLFRTRRRVSGIVGLAYPSIFEIQGREDSPAVRQDAVSRPRRGVGDDFHGLREYGEGEDARLINWKLTAKTGRPLVKEYSQQVGNRITITVGRSRGPESEPLISEAASLAKFFIDAGADVSLRTPEKTIVFGHGLLHLGLILKTLALLGDGSDVIRHESPPPEDPPAPFGRNRRLSPYAYLTAAFAFGSLFLIEEVSPFLLLPFALIIPLGRRFDLRNRYPLPRKVFDLLGGAILVFFLFIDLPRSGSLQAVTRLILFILASILFNPKTGKAPAHLFLASFLVFFLSSGQALSLWYFPLFLAYFLAAGAWLMDLQDPAPRARAFRPRPDWGGSLLAVTAAAAGIAALAFIVLPRPSTPGMRQLLAGSGLVSFGSSHRTFAGLSDGVELGHLGPIGRNTARVMRVSFDGEEAGSRPSFIRVRAAAFDVFDGRRWIRTQTDFDYRIEGRTLTSRRSRAWMRRERGLVFGPSFDSGLPSRAVDFVLEPLVNTAFVFGVGDVTAIETRIPGAFFDHTDTISFPSPASEGMRYRVLSQGTEPSAWRSIEGYEIFLRTNFLSVPRPDDRLRAWAEGVTAEAEGPLAKAAALSTHLRENFSYSTSARHGRQDLEAFVFETRAGNCEYFATAMCLILRHLGIPSRLAIGFLSDEWNAYGSFFDVRQSDAHAWVEAFFPDRGWTTFDPTPSDESGGAALGWLSRLWGRTRTSFESVQYRWFRYVVGYDAFTQRNALYNLGISLGRSILPLALGVAALALVSVSILALRRPRRRKRRRTGKSEEFFETALDRLERAGYARRPSQTAAEFAAELVRDRAEFGPLARLAERHYARRYAGRIPTDEDRAAIRGEMDAVLAAARRFRRRAPRRPFLKRRRA